MKVVVAAKARRDLFVVLAVSRERFGVEAERRYRALLEQAISDLQADPDRAGVVAIDEVRDRLRLYHSRHARQHVTGRTRVARPRHVIVFRLEDDTLEVLRVLHDAMDLRLHLSAT